MLKNNSITPSLLIQNANLLSMAEDCHKPILSDIYIEGDCIANIQSKINLSDLPQNTHVLDAKNKLVTPGLINTHTHSAMTLLRGLMDDIPMQTWLHEHIFPAESLFTQDFVYWGSKLACWEMIRNGITSCNDMYFFAHGTAQAMAESNFRSVVGSGLIDFPTPKTKHIQDDQKRWHYFLETAEDLIQTYQNNNLITPYVAPHSVYGVSPQHLKDSLALAQTYDCGMHIHVSEAPQEQQMLKDMHNIDLTPIQHLHELGLTKQKMIAAHMVWLNDKDIDIVRDDKVGIAHCPKSNLKLSSGYEHSIERMLEQNIAIGIATDGAASNNNLNLWEEMRFASLVAKKNDPTVLPAKQAFSMITSTAAKALHQDHVIGTIEAGKKADLILINQDSPNQLPFCADDNVFSRLVYTCGPESIDTVIIGGTVMMQEQNMNSDYFDTQDISEKCHGIRKHIRENI